MVAAHCLPCECPRTFELKLFWFRLNESLVCMLAGHVIVLGA